MKLLLLMVLGIALAVGSPTATVPFSTRLFAEISTEHSNENVVFSPDSIKSALGLAYMGAGGSTAAEIYNVAQLTGNTKDEVGAEFRKISEKLKGLEHVKLSTANRIYLSKEYTIAPTYKELVSKYFGGVSETVDFAQSSTVEKINAWVEEQTNHKIRKAVDDSNVDGNTRIILVNAIYFKASWRYAFKHENTQELPFYMSKEFSKPVKMMNEIMEIDYAELPEMNAKAIELPYSGTDIKMLIILPDEVEGLASLENKLKQVDLTHFPMEEVNVNVTLPKFKIEFDTNLTDVLKKLGIRHLFGNTDFSSMVTSNGESLSVTNAIHKAFIEVDEQGTEAAAVTLLDSRIAAISPNFFIDHPFVFAIKDANTVYFAGHVTKF